MATQPVTTASRLATITPYIDNTGVGGAAANTAGGAVALTSAAATPLGKAIAGSEITANNRLYRESLVSFKATSVTAFAEGQGFLNVRIRRNPSN